MPVVGPMAKADFGSMTQTIATSLGAAIDGDRCTALAGLNAMFGAWCDLAETELEANTGDEQKVHGTRGRCPVYKWAPLIEGDRKKVIQVDNVLVEQLGRIAMVRDQMLNLCGTALAIEEGQCLDEELLGDLQETAASTLRCVTPPVGSFPSVDPDRNDTLVARDRAINWHATSALSAAYDAVNAVSFALFQRCHSEEVRAVVRDVRLRAVAVVEEARNMEAVMEEEEAKIVRTQWQGLLRGATKTTTKRAFQATQLPADWRPEEVEESGGLLTADPLRVLQAARDKLNKMWFGGDSPGNLGDLEPWGGGTPLRRLTAEQLRAASAAFPRTTSETYDGFHVSHYRLLSDAALDVLASILELCECLCVMPSEIQTVEIALIPKPKGGHRPIGVYSSLERLHGKARQDDINLWMAGNAREYFANSRGSGAFDVVWAQAVRAESAKTKGRHYCALLWDLAAFFETIDYDILLDKARRAAWVPLPLVHMAINAFKAPRLVGVKKRYAEPVHPSRGVLAGHAFAMAMVHLYYLDDIDEVLVMNPGVLLDIYVDDHTLTVVGDSEDEVVDKIVAAATGLHRVVTQKLKCGVSWAKAASASSSKSLAAKVRQRLGSWVGKNGGWSCVQPWS